jgi:CheY-like chemotaxis protein
MVSGDVQERLESRSISDDVTDYFDKALGFNALATFIKGYVAPEAEAGGEVLYVEDSRVVAMATRRMLEKHNLTVTHATGVEDAIAHLETMRAQGKVPGPDIVLTDVYLKGELTGKDLLHSIRHDFGYAKGLLPVLVMTGDANPANQSDLLREGANDLVQKPIEERLLITKLLFQLRVGRMLREKLGK